MTLKRRLKDIFGYKSFRDNQEPIIRAILEGRDVFAAMPTGGGKSLCYQLPAVILDGITIVVSPLVALMKDQVDEAVENGIPAAFINSTLSQEDSYEIYSRLFRGEIKLLYLSPERLSLEGYFEKLGNLNVSFFAVDEAHCLSEWGHDFRPDYLNLSGIKKHFPSIPVAAFTATATLKVQSDIIRMLGLDSPLIVRASFNRPELFYRVDRKNRTLDQIAEFILQQNGAAGIVYRSSRKDAEKTAEHLSGLGIRAGAYHAGLSNDRREKNQDLFNRDRLQVICATIAFGMGINKSNIRFVIHGDLPRSIEGYYQETGRAGRDGLESRCLLLYSPADIMKTRYHIERMENRDERKKAEDRLRRVVSFASVNVCRRKQLLEYFDEGADADCGSCDVCTDLTGQLDASLEAQKFLSAVARTGERFGRAHIIDIVSGADTEKIRKFGHQRLKTWGVGRDRSKNWWRGLAEDLISQQALICDEMKYGSLKMTGKGREILFGREPFYIIGTQEEKLSASVKTGLSSRDYDQKMFEMLKDIRFGIARSCKVPPYIIFSDKSLRDMCIIKPVDDAGFLRVSGVGERKLAEYGPMFIPGIRKYLGYDG